MMAHKPGAAVMMAAMLAAGGLPDLHNEPPQARPTPVPPKQHDPERLAAAQAKRARKAAKRLQVNRSESR